jgi:hypothetical protein
MSNPAAALQVTRALAVMALAECRRDHGAKMAFPLSVVPSFGFGEYVGYYGRGAVVANVAALAVAILVVPCIGVVFAQLRGRLTADAPFIQTVASAARFPGSIAVAVAFVVGGTAMGATMAAAHSITPALDVPIACAVFLLIAGAVVVMCRQIRNVTNGEITYVATRLVYTRGANADKPLFPDPSTWRARFFLATIFGRHAWVSIEHGSTNATVLDMFGMLFTRYRVGPGAGRLAPYFFVIELATTVLVSAVSGLLPMSCGAIANTLSVVTFCSFAFGVVAWPYNVASKNFFNAVMDFFAFVGTAMIAAGVQNGNEADGTSIARSGTRVILAAMYLAVLSSFMSVTRFVLMRAWGCGMRRVDQTHDNLRPLLDIADDRPTGAPTDDAGATTVLRSAATNEGGAGVPDVCGSSDSGSNSRGTVAAPTLRDVMAAPHSSDEAAMGVPLGGALDNNDSFGLVVEDDTDDDADDVDGNVQMDIDAVESHNSDATLGELDSDDDDDDDDDGDDLLGGPDLGADSAAHVEYSDVGRRLKEELEFALRMTTQDVLASRHRGQHHTGATAAGNAARGDDLL